MHDTGRDGRPSIQLTLATISFAVCFTAWGLISAFAPRFREIYHLTAFQTAFMVSVPVLLGSPGSPVDPLSFESSRLAV